jgi:RNA polymerase primary sigma factor
VQPGDEWEWTADFFPGFSNQDEVGALMDFCHWEHETETAEDAGQAGGWDALEASEPDQQPESEPERAGGFTPGSFEKASDALGHYLRSIGRIALLSPTAEHALALRAAAGDMEARARLVECNLRLVVSVAKRYQGMGIGLADLIADGNLGLIRAIERFDPHRGVRVSTYASKWIRQTITRALANHSRTVRLPANVVELVRLYRSREQALMQRNGRATASDEVCESISMERGRWEEMASAALTPLSLDLPLGGPGSRRLHEVITDDREGSALDAILASNQLDRLRGFLTRLPDRERLILGYRFGLDGKEPHSLEETGRFLGVTRERIRQLEERALRRLREMDGTVEVTPRGARASSKPKSKSSATGGA